MARPLRLEFSGAIYRETLREVSKAHRRSVALTLAAHQEHYPDEKRNDGASLSVRRLYNGANRAAFRNALHDAKPCSAAVLGEKERNIVMLDLTPFPRTVQCRDAQDSLVARGISLSSESAGTWTGDA